MSEVKSICVRIQGKVQGVFFRASTQQQASALGLHGFTRNESDGSVYIEAEGPADSLEQFIKWCHQGPPRATVHRVEVSEQPSRGFHGFEVRR
ncbi:MAG: acylphosphatase [Bacteroidetes bacterium]|nr:acylphosphatase [Bacteroidota bacterium]